MPIVDGLLDTPNSSGGPVNGGVQGPAWLGSSDELSHRTSPTDGQTAADLPDNPTSEADIRNQLQVVRDGLAALQSTDDLGPERNRRVYEQEQALWAKYEKLQEQLSTMADE